MCVLNPVTTAEVLLKMSVYRPASLQGVQGWDVVGSEKRGRTGAADGGLKSPPKPVIRSLPFFHSG